MRIYFHPREITLSYFITDQDILDGVKLYTRRTGKGTWIICEEYWNYFLVSFKCQVV